MSTMDSAGPLVLLTGSTGLVGARIVADLSSDHRVVGLDLEQPAEGPPLAGWFHCDLTDDASVERALGAVKERFGERVASVIHLAGYCDFSGEPSPLYEELTVRGTGRLLRALRPLAVEQVLFSSSMLVMKPAEEGELLDESAPVEADWDYPRSKLEAERVLRASAGPWRRVALRIAGVYDEDCHSIPIAHQIRRVRESKFASTLLRDGAESGQAFVHVDDVAACVRKALERRAELGEDELFLVAEPELLSYRELQDTLGELFHGGARPTIRVAPFARAGARLGGVAPWDSPFVKPWMIDLAGAHYPVDASHARLRLGWEPRRRLRDMLPRMVARLQRDPRGWYEENGLPLPVELQEPASR